MLRDTLAETDGCLTKVLFMTGKVYVQTDVDHEAAESVEGELANEKMERAKETVYFFNVGQNESKQEKNLFEKSCGRKVRRAPNVPASRSWRW